MQNPFSPLKVRACAAVLAAMGASGLIATSVVFVAPTASASAPKPKSTIAALGAPVISSVKVTPAIVAGGGGTATVTAKLQKSLSCQLKVVSRPLFKVTVPNAQPCKSTYTAYVKLGANPTSVKRAVALDLVASHGASATSALLYVSLAPKPALLVTAPPATTPSATTTTTAPLAVGGGGLAPPPPVTTTSTTSPPPTASPTTTTTTTTTVPTTTTTVPTTTTTTTAPTPSTQPETTDNWSGYAVTDGPYTMVQGTFTVPYVTTAATCDELVSEWAGIDGFSDTSLIQAGVTESMIDPDTGGCTPGEFYIHSWWEIVPAVETPITTWDDATAATVNAGDQVTVTIGQVSGTTWAIEVADDTSGESFITDQTYAGPGSSAEWIVEAPTSPTLCGGQCMLAPYSDSSGGGPGVLFSSLGVRGTETTLWQIEMVQNGAQVSTPSARSSDGFSVSYMGPEAAPEGFISRPMHGNPVTANHLLYLNYG